MKAHELAKKLLNLPNNDVYYIYDGFCKPNADAAWLSCEGNVIIGDKEDPVYHTEDRPDSATDDESEWWCPSMKYHTVVAKRPIELDQMVNDLVNEGWYPQGGIAVAYEDEVPMFIQAVISSWVDDMEQIEKDIVTYIASLESESSDKH